MLVLCRGVLVSIGGENIPTYLVIPRWLLVIHYPDDLPGSFAGPHFHRGIHRGSVNGAF